jgi:hypothetical protein
MHIPKTDAVGGRRSADTTPVASKGKGKIAPSRSAIKADSRSPSSDAEALAEEIAPLQRKRMLIHSDGSTNCGPPPPTVGAASPKGGYRTTVRPKGGGIDDVNQV